MQLIPVFILLMIFVGPVVAQDDLDPDSEYCQASIAENGYSKDRMRTTDVIQAHDGVQALALDPFEKCVALGEEVDALNRLIEIDQRCNEALTISDRGWLSATMGMQTTFCDPSEMK